MSIVKSVFKQKILEYSIPLLAALSLFFACLVVSSKKYFWNDELLSFYLLSDPSLPHMLVAWSDKFNQAPPLYFILGWVWDKLFGSTELALRLFSSVTIGLACIVIWATLRRTYDFWASTVGAFSIFCLSELVLYHNTELRMYGLFSAVCAIGLLHYDSLNRAPTHSRKDLFINTLIHCTIVLTHLYGVFYSFAILTSFIIYDKRFGNFRRNVYLSVIAGWSILIPLAPLIINQSNNSAKWFQNFSFSQTIGLLTPFPRFFWFVLALLAIAAFLQILKFPQYDIELKSLGSNQETVKSEISLLILSIAFLAVPMAAWVITVTVKPLLNDRYIIPTIVTSWPILLTYLITRIMPNSRHSWGLIGDSHSRPFSYLNLRALALAAIASVLIIHPLYYAKKWPAPGAMPGANDAKYGYAELPIATEAGHDFLSRFYYSSKPSRYFHILDWETAVNNVTSAFATGDYVHLNAISTHYPFIQSIQSRDFLEKYDRFLVLNEEDQKWFESRVQNSSAYRVKELGEEPGANAPLTVFLVERVR